MKTDLIGETGNVLDHEDYKPLYQATIRGVYLNGNNLMLIVEDAERDLEAHEITYFQLDG